VAKQVLAGERVSYDGEHYDLDGFRLRCAPPEPAPASDAAGMRPKAVELAGRFADGWHALMLTREGIRDRLADFDRGSEMGDRDRESQEVILSLTCCVDEDREHARRLVKQHICFYVGGIGTFYRDALARQGYEELGHESRDNWNDGDRGRIATFGAIDGLTVASVSFPRAAEPEDIDRTIEALAPE
jgi:alkanesulfonate monooxygenase SsuD/methylene tetrahydromethanopterin reductase-like flavin-dependent oxidoreductase (luciferase family)